MSFDSCNSPDTCQRSVTADADVGGGADMEAAGVLTSAADGASPAVQNLTCYQGAPGGSQAVTECPAGSDAGMCVRFMYTCTTKERSMCVDKKVNATDMCAYFKAFSPSEVVYCDAGKCNGRELSPQELLVRGAPDGTVSKSRQQVSGKPPVSSIPPVATEPAHGAKRGGFLATKLFDIGSATTVSDTAGASSFSEETGVDLFGAVVVTALVVVCLCGALACCCMREACGCLCPCMTDNPYMYGDGYGAGSMAGAALAGGLAGYEMGQMGGGYGPVGGGYSGGYGGW